MDTIKIIDDLNIKYVHRRISHHASHSGYTTIFEHMRLPKAESKFMQWLVKLIPESIKWRLHHLRPQPVGDDGLIPELLALPFTASRKKGLCHFIYGEDNYFYTKLWRNANKKIIASYHYPPVRLDERVSKTTLKTLNAVILMSNSQCSWFEHYLPKNKIYVIPHHVDTGFFIPLEENLNKLPYRIISLGGILRDMELLYSVVEQLTKKLGREKIIFDFLMPKEYRSRFKEFSNVNLYNRISDQKLLELYQGATIGFMPLLDCTANNAVLEMMSSGKAVVCSNVGGIEDYLDEAGALLFHPEISLDELVDSIIKLLENKELIKNMGKHNRGKVLKHFSIDATKEKLYEVYRKVLDAE